MKNDYYFPERYLIVASIRSGGTLLSHALDSHPDIYCHRGEPAHKLNPVRKLAPDAITAIDTVLSLHGYYSNVAKVTWEQYWILVDDIEQQLNLNGVILLHRNPLRVYISEQIRLEDKRQGVGLAHSFIKRPKTQIEIDINECLTYIKDYQIQLGELRKRLQSFYKKTLQVSYEDLTAEYRQIPRVSAAKLCSLCNVGYRLLTYTLAQRNPYPIAEIVTNYEDLQQYRKLKIWLD